jgi:hypothetical protein
MKPTKFSCRQALIFFNFSINILYFQKSLQNKNFLFNAKISLKMQYQSDLSAQQFPIQYKFMRKKMPDAKTLIYVNVFEQFMLKRVERLKLSRVRSIPAQVF